MRNRWIWLTLLIFIIFLAGCTNQQTPTNGFKNDVITIEDYHTTRALYSGSTTKMDFYIKNNNDDKIGNVEVNFFSKNCFSVVYLSCESGEKIGSCNEGDECKCVFKDIESRGLRHIVLQLKIKSDVAKQVKTECLVIFSVTYNHTGTKYFNIPIIDTNVMDTPSLTGGQSSSGYGPILLDIQPLVEKETTIGGETVKQYWGAVDQIFEVDFKFTYAGTIPIGNTGAEKVTLSPENVKLSYPENYLELQEPCDVGKKSMIIPDTDERRNTLICTFKALPGEQSEYLAQITVDYSYTYKFIVTETFEVFPR